jgi:hypothetical protein
MYGRHSSCGLVMYLVFFHSDYMLHPLCLVFFNFYFRTEYCKIFSLYSLFARPLGSSCNEVCFCGWGSFYFLFVQLYKIHINFLSVQPLPPTPHPTPPEPGGLYPQEQGWPIISQGTGFPFCCLLQLVVLWWRYLSLPPHNS